MSKARELANLGNAYSDGALSNRNLIINGAMQVAQRGTSFTNSSNTIYYTLDRWHQNNSSETITTTQQVNTASDAATTGQRYFMRNVVSTSGNYAGICQRIENVFQFDNKTFTLSFWARGGAGGGNVPTTFRVYGNGLSAGTIIDTNLMPSTNISLTSSWQYYTVTFTTVPLTFASYTSTESNTCLQVFFQQTTAETCDFDLTGVSLEVGDTATPFEHEPVSVTLAKCQRYYEVGRLKTVAAVKTFSSTSTNDAAGWDWRVIKRATPTVTIYSATGTADRISLYNSGTTEYVVSFVNNPDENGVSSVVTTTNFERDVLFSWIAEAEL